MNQSIETLARAQQVAATFAVEFAPRLLAAALVLVSALADSSVEIAVRPWVAVPDSGVVTGELNRALVGALRARGVAIALPQQQVRLLPSTGSLPVKP